MAIPPKFIPSDLYDLYTMNGTIDLYDWYIDERTPIDKNTTLVWTNSLINSYINKFTFKNIYENKLLEESYKGASLDHVQAISKYSEFIKNKDVAVIGSQRPWIEAILLNAGVKSVTTIEYNVPSGDNTIIKTLSYDDFCIGDIKYDSIFSYSSIEHSGLGRYGDKLNPNGDMETMKHIYNALNDNGRVFIGFPVGKDAIVWNAHRVYGEKRLKLLFSQFEEVEWMALDKSYIYNCQPQNNGPHPLIILRKK